MNSSIHMKFYSGPNSSTARETTPKPPELPVLGGEGEGFSGGA